MGSRESHHLFYLLSVRIAITVLGAFLAAGLGIEWAEQPFGSAMHEKSAAFSTKVYLPPFNHRAQLSLCRKWCFYEMGMITPAKDFDELYQYSDVSFCPGEIETMLHNVNTVALIFVRLINLEILSRV